MTLILVVDDMAVFREPIAAALRARGHEVICAGDGREALGVMKTRRPDVVLLDVAMPVMDGLEFLRSVDEDPSLSLPPVILLTAVSERDYVIKAARLGVREYLLKSQFSLEEMMTRIDRCLGGEVSGPGGEDPPAETPPPPRPAAADDAEAPDPPRLTRSEVLGRLRGAGELDSFSPVVSRVLQLTESPSSTVQSIADAIKQDHGLAIKVLKLANSSVYTRGQPVETLDKAVVRIGLQEIRQAVMNIGVVEQFGACSVGEIPAGEFWEHALACGIIAAEIARELDRTASESAFTMGLVHDVGRLYLARALPEAYDGVLRAAAARRIPLEEAETVLLEIDHAAALEGLLESWNFPRELIDPIVRHHRAPAALRRGSSPHARRAATLALADRICHALMLGRSGNETIYPTEDLWEHLALPPDLMRRLEETTRSQTETLKLAMLARAADPDWGDTRARHRAALTGPLRPLYVSARPEIDAHRIFFEQLAEVSDAPPNVGIMRLTGAGDRPPLSRRLAEAEGEARAHGLPLLVLSPTGDLHAEQAVLGDRWQRALPTPGTIAAYLEAVNAALADTGGRAAAA